MKKIVIVLAVLVGAQAAAKSQPKSYYFGASTTYATFSSKALTATDLEYDIDPKLLTSVEGSFKITKRFRGLLNVNFDSAEIDKTFQVLGLIASRDMLLQLTSGKFRGNASLTSEILSSPITFDQDTETKYLSADLLFRMKGEWLKDTFGCGESPCYHGLRVIKYQLPAEILTSGRFGGSEIEDAPSFLDPEFGVTGVMYTISINTLRSFALGEVDETGKVLSEKDEEKSGEVEKKEEAVTLPKPAPSEPSTYAGIVSIAVGWGKGQLSDAGKLNISNATSGKTVENESRDLGLFDSTFAFYKTWNWQKKHSRWTLGLGYLVQMNLTYDFDFSLGEDAPEDASVVRFDDAGIGYLFHGPSLAFYGTF